MKRIFITIAIIFAISSLSYAQEANKGIKNDTIKNDAPLGNMKDQPIMQEQQNTIQPIVDTRVDLPSDADVMKINPKATEIDLGQPYLVTWRGGMLTGYHGTVSDMLSFRNIVGVNAYQQLGRFSMNGGLSLSQGIRNGIGIVNGMGANVQLAYLLSPNVILTAFGGLDRYGFMSPAPNATAAYYGGYMTFLTNNGKWGMDVGASTSYNSLTGRWETVPIAMPYYNLNGAKLGVNVGGLLYSIFDKRSNNNYNPGDVDSRRGPTVIAPPINTKPHFDHIETPKWAEEQNKDK